jgi:hypothetical protein
VLISKRLCELAIFRWAGGTPGGVATLTGSKFPGFLLGCYFGVDVGHNYLAVKTGKTGSMGAQAGAISGPISGGEQAKRWLPD